MEQPKTLTEIDAYAGETREKPSHLKYTGIFAEAAGLTDEERRWSESRSTERTSALEQWFAQCLKRIQEGREQAKTADNERSSAGSLSGEPVRRKRRIDEKSPRKAATDVTARLEGSAKRKIAVVSDRRRLE